MLSNEKRGSDTFRINFGPVKDLVGRGVWGGEGRCVEQQKRGSDTFRIHFGPVKDLVGRGVGEAERIRGHVR